jgi:hypothetical protein
MPDLCKRVLPNRHSAIIVCELVHGELHEIPAAVRLLDGYGSYWLMCNLRVTETAIMFFLKWLLNLFSCISQLKGMYSLIQHCVLLRL